MEFINYTKKLNILAKKLQNETEIINEEDITLDTENPESTADVVIKGHMFMITKLN